jgi:hypothetical protein
MATRSAMRSTAMVAPSFDTFLTHSCGSWRGAGFTWTPSPTDADGLPLGIAPGAVTRPAPSATTVEEVMRSCGGAVQGVDENRATTQGDGKVFLNRQHDGTTFFSFGSWAQAPPFLSDAEESDMTASPDCFGISACLAHDDRTRVRVLAVIADRTVACCDVAIEGDASMDGVPSQVAALLEGRLQCIVEAKAWEGGATTTTLVGSQPMTSAEWMNARTRWVLSEGQIDGGSALVPPPATAESDGVAVVHLPGGCWVRVQPGGDTPSESTWDEAAMVSVEIGSLAVEAGEVKTITHTYSQDGRLAEVIFRKVVGRE